MTRKTLLVAGMLAAIFIGGAIVIPNLGQPPKRAAETPVYYCPMHPTYTSDRPGDCPICNMKLVKREPAAAGHAGHGQEAPGAATTPQTAGEICYLHNCDKLHEGAPCPMTVVAKPGEKVTCPVCGKYVAGEDGLLTSMLQPTAEGYAPVMLTPQRQQLIGIRVAPVERRAITKTIRTVGRIAYDPDLYQAQAEYLQSLAALTRAEAAGQDAAAAEARRLVDASRTKLRLMGLGEELIEDMAAWDGPDKSLLSAGSTGHVWLYAPVYEFELPLVRLGLTVRVDVPSVPGHAFEGTIRSIDPVLDPATRSARVRAVLTDPGGVLRPEMFVNASIEIAVGEVLAVPEEAVFRTGTQQIVFVDMGRGMFEPRRVTLGIAADGFAEVKDGLAAGERVVASGNFLIDSESRLQAALEGAGAPGHQHGQ